MKYTKIQCKSALHIIPKSAKPYHLDLNIYRGCEHKCQYCFATYSHKYMDHADYFNEIFIKENVAEVLDLELGKRKVQEIVNIGGICDSYQPIEKEMQLMRKVLKVCIKHETPIIISTKSDLILRDLDLLKELSKLTAVNIACTITCMNESIRSVVEPNTTPSLLRFKALEIIKKETNAIVGVHLMPIIPYLNDDRANLEAIYKQSELIHADYILCGTLYLRGTTRQTFFNMVDTHFPHLKNKLYQLYTNNDRKLYKQQLYILINELKQTYHANHNYMQPLNKRLQDVRVQQLTLF